MKISLTTAIEKLKNHSEDSINLFVHGTLNIKVYQPDQIDLQHPHEQDEVYVIISGKGIFFCDGIRETFAPGDVLFAPAGIVHRFEDFDNDFSTWVIFYGPRGGEEV